MPERKNETSMDDAEYTDNGVLENAGDVETTSIGIIGTQTSRVDVSMPAPGEEDEDTVDDDVIQGEIERHDEVTAEAERRDIPTDDDVADAEELTDDEAPAEDASGAADSRSGVAEPEAAVPASGPVTGSTPEAVVARARTRRSEVTLTSKRLGDLSDSSRESAELLTADRLLDPTQVSKPEPEGAWNQFIYALSGKRINLGDSKSVRDRKALSGRISAPLTGGARFVPVLSRKGGVGKTTITTLLGMALADARDDRIIAVDANPDRGTLAERIARPSGKTVRDLVRAKGKISGYNDVSDIVARDETRLDVLASDADPHLSEAFNDSDYRDVATVAAHYYSIVLTDTGTGIVHSVMGATLELADQIIVVSGLSIDGARLASDTLTWLETNGFAEQARNAVVVLNQAAPGQPMLRLDEVETHFRSRVRDVVRMPYDPMIATGGAITFRELQPATRLAARELAAKIVEGLRALPHAA